MDLVSLFISVVGCVIVVFITSTECGRLNDYILDYQPLVYDRSAVHRNHQRVRRSADPQLHVRFHAYGRDFHLQLTPLEGVFGAKHQVYTQGVGLRPVDTSFIYQGHVKGETNSWVHVAVHNGSMEGQVSVADTTYHIEPAAKYRKDHKRTDLHTIIYPETHMDTDPYRERRKKAEEGHGGTCGIDHDAIHEFMEKASRLDEGPRPNAHSRKQDPRAHERASHNIYAEHINREKRSSGKASSRHKRDLGLKSACSLHMRADPLLFQYFKKTKHGQTIEDSQAEEEILAFFASHVNTMSHIYSTTVFETYSGSPRYIGINFVIHQSTIMKNCSSSTVSNDYCSNSLDVSNYLDLTSRENNDLYCLAITVTYRDFSGGTLGLAWVATLANYESGVCGRHTRVSGGGEKSLNTGIITIINFGQTVPNRVSQLTMAHEVGHNFGSPHDIGSAECAPFGTSRADANEGNYIMFPSATSGDKPHNDEFSPCSRDNMTRIIEQVLDGTKRTMCFVESGSAFCGNKITEEGEACDCGFGVCDPNTCCEGRDINTPGSGCKLRAGIQCSPDSGPCCKSDCDFKAANSFTCEQDSECKHESNCTGSDFRCPEPNHKANGTYCNNYSKVCSGGECIGPVCQNIIDGNGEWVECFLTSDTGDNKDLCFVACKNPSTGECISSKNTDALTKNENAAFKSMLTSAASQKLGVTPSNEQLPIQLPPGSACDNFLGYCDTFNMCQKIDAQGPFNQLADMIFNPVTLTKIKDWIMEHWWAVLLMALGLVVFLGIFIKVFSYNTPSYDPKTRPRGHNKNMRRSPGKHDQPEEATAPAPPYTIHMDEYQPGHR